MRYEMLFKSFVAVVCMFGCVLVSSAQPDTVIYSNGQEKVLIGDKMMFFRGNLSGTDVDFFSKKEAFTKSNSQSPNFSVTKDTVWAFFTIKNVSSLDEIIIKLDYPIIDKMELFLLKSDGLELLEKTGDAYPFNSRKIKATEFLFGVTIPKDSVRTYVLKVNTEEQLILPIWITSRQEMTESGWTRNLIIGLSFGILSIMFFYNLFIYILVRDQSYFYYVFYIFFIGLTQASLLGYTYQYLWPNWPDFNNKAILIFPSIAGMSAILFIRNFTNSPLHLPVIDKVFMAGLGLYAVAIGVTLFDERSVGYKMVDVSAIFSSSIALLIGIVLSIRGYRAARFFLLAWSIFLVGVCIFVLRNFGVIALSDFSNFTMLFGAALESAFLSFALADRINILKKEKEVSQQEVIRVLQENERLIIEQNMELENRVTVRTKELETAYNDLKSAQSQLVDQEKMASLGQLTAGIAHEVNNPINFVVSSITPLRRDIDDMKEVLELYEQIKPEVGFEQKLAEIEKLKKEIDLDFVKEEIELLLNGIKEGAERTSQIVKSLKNFSRVDEEALKMADINEGIASTILLLSQQWKDRIEVEQNLGSIPIIECYPGKLNQVFMNIITNAIQAVESRNDKGKGGKIVVTTKLEGEQVNISIQDNGTGISEEVRKKMFEPFFTTKDVGKGTGLGLSITYGVVEKHKGTIGVKSVLGDGTEFVIKLPVKHEG
jgi:two-component system, NtrC family, sensor kinase